MRVNEVEYLNDYKLKLTFSDRKVKVVDLSEIVNGALPIFKPLKNLSYFKRVKCDGLSIMWPNEADRCPDALYKMGTDVAEQTKRRKRATSVIKRRRQLKATTVPKNPTH